MKNLLIFTLLLLSACNSKVPQLTPINGIFNKTSQIRVVVEGLDTNTITVQLNGEESLVIDKNGVHEFTTILPEVTPFEVLVSTQSATRSCRAMNPTGYVSPAGNTVRVKCISSSLRFVGGKIVGHSSGDLIFELRDSPDVLVETLTVPGGEQTFSFESGVLPANHQIVIISSPPGSLCELPIPSPSLNIQASDFSSVENEFLTITCRGTAAPRVINVQVTGLSSDTLSIMTSYGAYSVGEGVTNIETSDGGRRAIFRITGISNNDKRCSFVDTKSDFISLPPDPLATTTTLAINCVPRNVAITPCSLSSFAFDGVEGTLMDVECLNGKIFYAGNFKRIGKILGIQRPGIAGTAPNDHIDRINGKINKIVPDAMGGLFIGGSFRRVADKKKLNLVHLDSRMIIDETFDIETDGEVTDLFLEKNQLYITGRFSNVTKGSTTYPRPVSARIDISTRSPVVTSFSLPPYLIAGSDAHVSYVSDSRFFIHGNFNGVNQSLIFNKHSGNLLSTTLGQPERGTSVYWTDPSDKRVWLLHENVGMVAPETFVSHPLFNSKVTVTGDHDFVIDRDNTLYITSPTNITSIDLDLLASATAINFGGSFTISGAGKGSIIDSSTICFTQKGSAPIMYSNGSTPTQHGLYACFSTAGGLLGGGPPVGAQIPTAMAASHISAAPAPVLAATFQEGFYHNSPGLAVLDSDTNTVDNSFASGLPLGTSVNALAQDGTYVYFGGDFQNFSPCGGCDYLARVFTPSALTIDNTWTHPVANPVLKMKADGISLSLSTSNVLETLFAIDLSGTDAPYSIPQAVTPSEIHILGDRVLTRQGGYLYLRDFQDLSNPVRTDAIDTPATTVNGNFAIPNPGPSFRRYSVHDPNLGVLVGAFEGLPYTPGCVSVAGVNAHLCQYNHDNKVQCNDVSNVATTAPISLEADIVDEDHNVIKGVENYLFMGKGGSSPLVFAL